MSLLTRRMMAGALVPTVDVWSPADIDALYAWWDANDGDSFTFSSGTSVSEWRDRSGNGRHLSQGTGANQPTRNGTVNGRPSVVFNGTSTRLIRTTVAALGKPATILAVGRLTDASTNRNLIVGRTDGSNDGRVYRNASGIRFWQGASIGPGVQWGADARSVVGVFNGASSAYAYDSGSLVSGNLGTQTFQGTWTMGALGSAGGEHWQGDICEVVVKAGEITAGELAKWWDYCAAKWGTP